MSALIVKILFPSWVRMLPLQKKYSKMLKKIDKKIYMYIFTIICEPVTREDVCGIFYFYFFNLKYV
jgi:uncharacterized membrane protein YdjX (TVP38/TMEM64 family)